MLNYAQKNLDTKNSDVSPVAIRPMNTLDRVTLSPRERAVRNDCFEPSPLGRGWRELRAG